MTYSELPRPARVEMVIDQLIHEHGSQIDHEDATEADYEALYEMRGITLLPNGCGCCGEEIPDGTYTGGSGICDECAAQIWEDYTERDYEANRWGNCDEDHEADRAADRYEANYTGM